jgi:hypothetical protein
LGESDRYEFSVYLFVEVFRCAVGFACKEDDLVNEGLVEKC